MSKRVDRWQIGTYPCGWQRPAKNRGVVLDGLVAMSALSHVSAKGVSPAELAEHGEPRIFVLPLKKSHLAIPMSLRLSPQRKPEACMDL